MKDETRFIVIDRETGTVADPTGIAIREPWAKGLVHSDIEGFAITQSGLLILCDETGKFAYCPEDRFTVVFINNTGGDEDDMSRCKGDKYG